MEYQDIKVGCKVTITTPYGIPFTEYDWTEKEIQELEETFKSVIHRIRTKGWLMLFDNESNNNEE